MQKCFRPSRTKNQKQTSHDTIVLSESELEQLVGGLGWNVGFLAGINPIGALAVATGALVGLLSNYSAYSQGVNEGHDAYWASKK